MNHPLTAWYTFVPSWTVGLYWTLGAGLMQAYRIPWPNWSVLLQVWVNQFCVEYLVISLLPAFPVRAHPLEHLFLNVGATLSAPVGLQMNAWVVWVWMSLCVSNTLVAHLPYNKDIHYQHHRSPRTNYSVFGWMDLIHTTRNKNS